MQADFHYYATYCAAILAGYTHDEALDLCYSAQFVDCCTKTFLKSVGASVHAATSQSQAELVDTRADMVGLQDITRIWSSFHFLPKDLKAVTPRATKVYKNKYRLICGPNGELLKATVELAKSRSLQASGIAMHVLADTWAHMNFAGTPSLVINNTTNDFYEVMFDGTLSKISFKHAPGASDDIENFTYNNLPDYSFIRYKYLPAWDGYRECLKDNPSDYMKAFCQMICAMRYLRGDIETFETDTYDEETVNPYRERITEILTKRQLDASEDWKAFGEELSGQDIPDFDVNRYASEYMHAEDKDDTFLGKFILAALSQKSMVTNKIFSSGNSLAGFSIDYQKKGFGGIKDYMKLVMEKRDNS